MSSRQAIISAAASSSALFRIRVCALTFLTFFPYATFPVGESTNAPISSLVALTFLKEVLRHPRLALLCGFIIVLPLIHGLGLTLLGIGEVNLAAAVAWAIHVMPLVGFAGVASVAPQALRRPLFWALALSCGYAWIQYAAIESGTLLFVDLYEVPGYASVAAQEYEILNYVKRPFGWFPEPSFLAGSLALGVVAFVMIAANRESGRLERREFLLVLAVAATIFATRSGSGIVTIGLILLLAFHPFRRSPWFGFGLIAIAVAAARIAIVTITARGQLNYSWTDRTASLFVPFEYIYSSQILWLSGAGSGAVASLFEAGVLQVASGGDALMDTASILMRLFLELGLVLGTWLIASMAISIMRFGVRSHSALAGAVACSTWFLIAGATISYNSAALVWTLPGIAIGYLYAQREGSTGT